MLGPDTNIFIVLSKNVIKSELTDKLQSVQS